jgi:cell division protein ZapA
MTGRDPNNSATKRSTDNSVTVDIYDQTYRLRGHDSEYIHKLADIVDAKMRLVAAQGKTVDSLRVAVLASLNIADELARAEEKLRQLSGSLNETQSSIRIRANTLNGLLDSLLTEDRRTG